MSGLPPLQSRPFLGFGLELRLEHLSKLLCDQPGVDWLEITPESFLEAEPAVLARLERIREHYPISFHAISLDLGAEREPPAEYLQALSRLAERFEPALISDHLWGRGRHPGAGPAPRPLPRSVSQLDRIADRVIRVQELLGRRILLESVGSLAPPQADEVPEWALLTELAVRSDSLLLVDLGNLYATAIAKGFDPECYLRALPAQRVWELHLSTPLAKEDFVADDTTDLEADPVWRLFRRALSLFGSVSTLIERPDTLPELEDLWDDLVAARRISGPLLG